MEGRRLGAEKGAWPRAWGPHGEVVRAVCLPGVRQVGVQVCKPGGTRSLKPSAVSQDQDIWLVNQTPKK